MMSGTRFRFGIWSILFLCCAWSLGQKHGVCMDWDGMGAGGLIHGAFFFLSFGGVA